MIDMLAQVTVETKNLEIIGEVSVNDISVEIHRGCAQPAPMGRPVFIDVINSQEYSLRDSATSTPVAIVLKDLISQSVEPLFGALSKSFRILRIRFHLIAAASPSALAATLEARLGWTFSATRTETGESAFGQVFSVPERNSFSILANLFGRHLFPVHSIFSHRYTIDYTTKGGD